MIIIYSIMVYGLFVLSLSGLIISFILLKRQLASRRTLNKGILIRTKKFVASLLVFLIPLTLFILLLSLHNLFWNIHFAFQKGVWNYQYLPLESSYVLWVDESLETARLIKDNDKHNFFVSGILEYDQRGHYLLGTFLFEIPKGKLRSKRWFILNLETNERNIYLDNESFMMDVTRFKIDQLTLRTVGQHLDAYWSARKTKQKLKQEK